MLIYTTARKSNWPYILKRWSVSIAFFLVIVVYDQFFSNNFLDITDTFYWIAIILLLGHFIDLISKPRIKKIVIDENARNITQYYRSPFSGEGEKVHNLDKVQLYVKSKASSSTGAITTQSLELYKSWRLILDLDSKRDGFSPITLQEIRQVLEQLLVSVTSAK
jgi:hypothetical protein